MKKHHDVKSAEKAAWKSYSISFLEKKDFFTNMSNFRCMDEFLHVWWRYELTSMRQICKNSLDASPSHFKESLYFQ